MKSPTLNLIIIDSNTLLAGSISGYLNNRFGQRINLSTFFDVDKCIETLNEKSHVIILNYFLNGKNKKDETKNVRSILNSIKTQKPRAKAIIVTSDGDMAKATEEIQRSISLYILLREQHLHTVLRMFDKLVVSPIKTIAVLPIKKIIHYYSVKNYLMMFLIVFLSVGVLVFAGYLGAELLVK
jgi:hypothetical protein